MPIVEKPITKATTVAGSSVTRNAKITGNELAPPREARA